MSNPDGLLIDLAAKVESEHSNQMPLTVVVPGAVITGKLAPEAVWKQRVAEVLGASEHLKGFAGVFVPSATAAGDGTGAGDGGGRPTHLYFHVARILQGSLGLPETGGMYRVAIADVSSWTIGDLSYSEH
ncbi:hypothetical protein [Streptomyces sp. NPDC001380]|uniref:hypothetical protein n=1 Tax=Streptomyces sp. NPDC001380 TaxID=3364566 RepID=UPI0036A92D22